MLEQRLEQDIKRALLDRDAQRVSTLRQLKSELLNAKVAQGKRESGLSDEAVMQIFAREAKKRQESADLYTQGGDQQRAGKELAEKAVIESYLPAKLTEEEISSIIEKVTSASNGTPNLGQVIGQVKQIAGPSADGSMIARLVKERLSQ